MSEGTVIWIGADGTKYAYTVFNPHGQWNAVPGNYIFAKHSHNGWHAIYIGETESFLGRLTGSHEKWAEAARLGMTHIHAHTSNSAKIVRVTEERNLILNYHPPLNG